MSIENERRKEERRKVGYWGGNNPERRKTFGSSGRRALPKLCGSVVVDRSALKTLLEWCRDSIDFNDDTDAEVAKAFSIAARPLLADLTPEEDAAWDYGFAFHSNVGVDDDGAAYLTWMDLIEEFPRLKEYLGATPKIPNPVRPKKVGMF